MAAGDRRSADTSVEHLLRNCAPQVLGAVTRRYGDFGAAEDAVQEALIAAFNQWPVHGVPANPEGWLYQVAIRRLSDHVRSEASRARREEVAAVERFGDAAQSPSELGDGEEEDDALVLLFMCCHPALTGPSAIALTLRAVGGLTTAEIARAFLVPESTMAQRISRAKATIKSSNVGFNMPGDPERRGRVGAVLHVLYLIFNEGYTTSAGESLHRVDLSSEAIRLARMLRARMPDDPEVGGLLALMLLTDARRAARTGVNGELIPLDEQDRALWDRALIDEGIAIVSEVLPAGNVGPYQLQAAIAAIHDEATQAHDTDWRQIAALYALLERLSDNPMVSLNRAIATSMVDGPRAGLEMIETLDGDARIAGHYRLDAVRAHLHEKLGDAERARSHYHAAAERTASIPERNYLMMKAARLKEAR